MNLVFSIKTIEVFSKVFSQVLSIKYSNYLASRFKFELNDSDIASKFDIKLEYNPKRNGCILNINEQNEDEIDNLNLVMASKLIRLYHLINQIKREF